MSEGARNLHDPRKQLRSPRCLRILSGHREPFDDVPDHTPDPVGVASRSLGDRTRKKAWVHRSNVGPQQGGPSNSSVQEGECSTASGKDAGKRRAGKAGSVRLG